MEDHDEVFEKESDEVLDALGEMISYYDSRTAIICPEQYQKIELAYALLKKVTQDISGVTVSYKLNKPFKSMGSVSVESETLEFYNTKLFAQAITLANNVEVYPLQNDRVRLTLTFRSLTKPIE